MLGAIAGDIIGSAYEYRHSIKTKDFELFTEHSKFTDDSVLTIAIADALMNGNCFAEKLLEYTNKYPNRGYGAGFLNWVSQGGGDPYNSWGNGSAMRVGAVGMIAEDMEETLELAKLSAEITHNHPEGIKGAQAIAACVFMARDGADISEIESHIYDNFYKIDYELSDIRDDYKFEVSCQGSVPQAILCFLESNDFEDAIRNAISLGGDADTQGAMAGAIAESYYGIPKGIGEKVLGMLDDDMKLVIQKFYETMS